MANFIAAHTHFCLTETFVNFDPTPNALRNTTPFSQQNNQQNRLSHATVLRETFRFFNPYSQLPNSEGVLAPNTRINCPQDNRLQDTDHWSRAISQHDVLLNQPSTGHRSLIKSTAQPTVHRTPIHWSRAISDRSTYRPTDTITAPLPFNNIQLHKYIYHH